MDQQLLFVGCVYLLSSVCLFRCETTLLSKYKISLFADAPRLSTLLWLRPAYCMYEEWLRETLDTSLADRKTSLIIVQISDPKGENGTYVVPGSFKIPQCNLLIDEPQPMDQFAYRVGPIISTPDGISEQGILPGHSYRIRYIMKNAKAVEVARTNWSEPFQTRDVVPSARDINVWLQGRSGGMVVITVILSVAMFLLLVGLAVVLGTTQH